MNPKQPVQPAPMITLNDVYYIIFRHKWMILILTALALGAALSVCLLYPWPYQSEARLLIKYIKETRPPQEPGADLQVTTPDRQGGNIINSEIAILTSMDLAEQVADIIGPAQILGKSGGGTNRFIAAGVIESGLTIPMETKNSDVITVLFTHKDPQVASNVLAQLIETYEVKHKEVHSPEYNDYMTQAIDRIKADEQQTDAQLREAKSNANIVTVDDSKKRYNDLMASLQAKLDDAMAEEAGYRETIKQMTNLLPAARVSATSTNAGLAATPQVEIPPEKAFEYQRLNAQLAGQQADMQKLLGIFTTNYPDVRNKQAQIDQTEALTKALEQSFPTLLAMKQVQTQGAPVTARPEADPREALNEEIIKSDALAAKIQVLTNQIARVQNMGTTIIAQEGRIDQLQVEKAGEEAQLVFYSQKLQDARSSEYLTGNSNISVVETPTPPGRDMKKIIKITLTTLFVGLALAFALPFLIELVLDRSLKHPMDVQSKLGLPFFISIPRLNGNGKAHALNAAKKPALLADKAGEGGALAASAAPAPAPMPGALANGGHLALWDEHQNLQPFYETLRDRLMTFFEMINLTHKPKLVAVTSCREGAGVTSTAVGLASSLSETGDSNVLLVNMNVRDGEAHHFYKGKVTCGLDEVLEKGTRESAFVQGNLYVAKEHEDERLPRILPKRFNHLLPKMKASDFDYIIFDMPPVSQISITPRLARFMDMVLLVIESGKTDRDSAKRAADLLSESKSNVGIVLNKNRSYIPRRLHQDI